MAPRSVWPERALVVVIVLGFVGLLALMRGFAAWAPPGSTPSAGVVLATRMWSLATVTLLVSAALALVPSVRWGSYGILGALAVLVASSFVAGEASLGSLLLFVTPLGAAAALGWRVAPTKLPAPATTAA